MFIRVVTAIIALLLFIPLLWYGSWPLEMLMTVLAGLGMIEFVQMKKIALKSFPAIVSVLGTMAIVLTTYLSPFLGEYTISRIIIMASVLLFFSLISQASMSISDVGSLILLMSYIGVGFYSFVSLRTYSLSLLFLLLIMIWATDSGAYLIGRKLGKNKLAPSISPNKTIEGSIGGTLLAAVISAVYLYFFPLFDSYVLSVLFVMILSVVGQLGDLIESKMKREFDTKDSGNLLPGHGGVLDRFDSMILVMNVVFLIGIL